MGSVVIFILVATRQRLLRLLVAQLKFRPRRRVADAFFSDYIGVLRNTPAAINSAVASIQPELAQQWWRRRRTRQR